MRERPYKRDLIGTRPWIIVYASEMSGLLVHSRASDDASHRLTTVKASGTWHGNLSMFNSRYPSFHPFPLHPISVSCLFAFHFCGGDCINRPFSDGFRLRISVKRTTNIRLRRDIFFDRDVNKRMRKERSETQIRKCDWIKIEDLFRKQVMFAQYVTHGIIWKIYF